MSENIVLYGASGHCKVVIDALKSNNIIVDSVIDDNPKSDKILGINIEQVFNEKLNKLANVIVTIGDNRTRKKVVDKLNCNFSKVIHSKAIVSEYATIEAGTAVFAGAVINPDAKIGQHCIINSSAVIEHDCCLENFVHISPNAALAGGVQVGEGAHVGIGAVVLQGVSIGKWVIVGAGAVVLKDIPNHAVAVGNPAKIIKINENS